MARMIPPTIHPSVRSSAERRMFALFQSEPGTDGWVCLHSLGLARHATKRRGEIDFLLLTTKGIFVLEVKGGRVTRDQGTWRFTDRFGVTHEKYESPFDQASSAMFSLEREVRQLFHDDARWSDMLFGFGVMFPDIVFEVTGTEADQRQVYDSRDLRRPIPQYVDRLASYWRERDSRLRRSPTKTCIEELVGFLRGDFDLIPSLGIRADEIAEQMLSLEKEQYAVLDSLEHFPQQRILVQGAAGTGKTLLAVEAGIREARKTDACVLLLCFNRLLASFLDAKIRSQDCGGGQIVVKSIYGLLNELIESSALADEFKSKREVVSLSTLYGDLFPEYAHLALIESNILPYKMVIIDEAQDMMTQELLDIIDAYVEGGFKTGSWMVFCDVNNQAAVFGSFEENALFRLMKLGQVLVLPTNRRNTRPIADETAMLTQPRVRALATVDGFPVKYSWYDSAKSQPASLKRVLKRFLTEGIAPARITVLSPRKAEDSCASLVDDPPLVQLANRNMWAIAAGSFDSISYGSVSAFKGLENDFIVLTDIEDLDSDWWRSVIYVGMSRARIGLHLFLSRSVRSSYEQRLHRWLAEFSSASKA